MPASDDRLRDAHTELMSFATTASVPVLPGLVSSQAHGLPVVGYGVMDEVAADPDPLATVRALTASLERLDLAMIVVDTTALTADDVASAVQHCEDRLADLSVHGAKHSDDPTEAQRVTALRTQAKSLKARIGHCRVLQVSAITRNPALIIEWYATAPWAAVLDEPVVVGSDVMNEDDEWGTSEEDKAERADYEARDRERRTWASGPLREQTARKLAADPTFPRCKREADRMYLLTTLLGEKSPQNQQILKEISRQADAIYRLELAASRT